MCCTACWRHQAEVKLVLSPILPRCPLNPSLVLLSRSFPHPWLFIPSNALPLADKWHVASCRGIKRRALMFHHTSPPYKLVPVNTSSLQPLPAVVHSTATAPLAKRKRVGMGRGLGAAGPAVPRDMLTSGSSQSHGQTSAARLLLHPKLGNVTLQEQGEGGQSAPGISLDAWQKQRRVVLECLLQQQAVALQGFKPASPTAGTQVLYIPV